MKHRIGLAALIGILALSLTPALAGDDVTLEGGFVWKRDDGEHKGDLKAILTPDGEGQWKVAFHFDWEDGAHVYRGTCSGSLDGELAGDVVGDGEREMKFKFSGSFKDGSFSGTHGFVDDEGTVKDSGTLTLAAAKG